MQQLRAKDPQAEVHDLLAKLSMKRDNLIRGIAEEVIFNLENIAVPLVGEAIDTAAGHPLLNERTAPFAQFFNLAPPRDYNLAEETIFTALSFHYLSNQLHSWRTGNLAFGLGAIMGLTLSELSMLQFAGWHHDIGKLAVPKPFLEKPGKLDRDEYEIMKMHQIIGYFILRNITRLRESAEVMKYNHLHQGYPDQFLPPKAPLNILNHIMIAADGLDATLSYRDYRGRTRISIEDVLNELRRHTNPSIPEEVLNAAVEYLEPASRRRPISDFHHKIKNGNNGQP